jgi:hypothetical protein
VLPALATASVKQAFYRGHHNEAALAKFTDAASSPGKTGGSCTPATAAQLQSGQLMPNNKQGLHEFLAGCCLALAVTQ